MKRSVIFLSVVLLLVGCNETAIEEPQAIVDTELNADLLFANLIELDQQLVKPDLSINKDIAKQLYTEAKTFTEKNPSHEKTADALELVAKTAESLGKYDEAINILHRLSNEFSVTDKTPSYLYNKARILEERLGKKENAKVAYEDLIQKFPEDPLAISAKQYLQMNYIEMSDKELIEFLEKQSQE